jgi:anti-anti-sigma factor
MIIHTNHHFQAKGDLLSTTVEAVKPELLGLFEKTPVADVHLDLTACQIIDSAGLNLVVSAIRLAREHEARIEITVSREQIRRIFMASRIDQHAKVILVK